MATKENPVALKLNQRAVFKELIVGAGSTLFKSNPEGVWLGATNYSSGLIRFSYSGNATFGSNSSGPSVAIIGSAGQIGLQYDGGVTGTIDGYTTEGAETSYIRLTAQSGRSIKIKASYIEFNGDIRPSSSTVNSVGSNTLVWNEVWAKTIIAYGTGSKFSCNGSDGVSASTHIISSIGYDGDQLRYKYRNCTTVGGIVTELGSESDWNNVS